MVSGYQLPKKEDDPDSIIDPFVRVDVMSVERDEEQEKQTAHTRKHGNKQARIQKMSNRGRKQYKLSDWTGGRKFMFWSYI